MVEGHTFILPVDNITVSIGKRSVCHKHFEETGFQARGGTYNIGPSAVMVGIYLAEFAIIFYFGISVQRMRL